MEAAAPMFRTSSRYEYYVDRPKLAKAIFTRPVDPGLDGCESTFLSCCRELRVGFFEPWKWVRISESSFDRMDEADALGREFADFLYR
jgi:hypothetical protein